jgi:hypothetical protein
MERSMLRNLTWQATDDLTRAQLAMFHSLGDQIGLTHDERGLALGLDERTWTAWVDFMSNGALPAEPSVPQMLRRLGETTFNLAMAPRR